MSREVKPCGTEAAYRRHLRNSETPCEACKSAHRGIKAAKDEARRAESAEAVRAAVRSAPDVDDVDSLDEAMDNLRIVRAVLRDTGTPANTVAGLTRRRDELVDRIEKLREAKAPVEVSVIDELTNRRRERRTAASG